MPKRTDIKKILIIGSGPIIIGQACEFDYSGTQACKVLRKEGYQIVLVNSNPATIMTDPELADRTYIEPLTVETLEQIIAKERPQALLPTIGGQTALNLATALAEAGILDNYQVELIGAKLPAIKKAEDRDLFKQTMSKIGLEVPESGFARNLQQALAVAKQIGFPLVIRPSFTLGGTGSTTVYNQEEFLDAASVGLESSPISQILIEESVIGWKEFELEVMRDLKDNVVIICSIENLDPMGVHTGDSITVAPAQTLSDKEYQLMRDAAIKVIRAIGVDTGGSNIQFALNPDDGRMVVIEMNPRVSRSSALASKATGFPIAKIAALLAVGYTLDEIPNEITQKTPACFEPTIDYVVVKVPRFDFEKFGGADRTLNTAMKSVGEVMAIGRTFKEALQKALRGLETGHSGLDSNALHITKDRAVFLEEIKNKLSAPNSERIFCLKVALQLAVTTEEIYRLSKIDPWFIDQINQIIRLEKELIEEKNLSADLLFRAKQFGFSDQQIAGLRNQQETEITALRKKNKIKPVYKLVDTCAGEFPAATPYYYSTYEKEEEDLPPKGKGEKVIILGGGPNRIGQGIEFDYCCVHAVFALKELGFQAIMVNCNPETVSTDYDISDRLYFEPLTLEDILHIVEREKPLGVIVQLGGQTPLNLALDLQAAKVPILGTSPQSIDQAEDRKLFGALLTKLKIPQPEHGSAISVAEAKQIAKLIGYPLMVRPSYVLGGRAMEIVYDEPSLTVYVERATKISPKHPILIDKYLSEAIEIDTDAICDGKDVYIGGIMEHIEAAGIHSGDSACALPPRTLSPEQIATIKDYTRKMAVALKVKGLLNIQYAIKDGKVYVLEVNPRASRTVPFVSKSTGIPLAKIATKVMVGKKLKDLVPKVEKVLNYVCVKEAVLPFLRFPGVDVILGPEMRSTGEVMGIDHDFPSAFAKSQAAAGSSLPTSGKVLLSLRSEDKKNILPIARNLEEMGFQLLATKNTAQFLRENNLTVEEVYKLGEGRPDIVDILKNRQVNLIINTPSGKKSRSHGYTIRRTAIIHNISIITTLSAAQAAVEAIRALRKGKLAVKPIQEYYQQ
ncbi:MAG: carbamoyl-phosphate synthase large subunit [Elusimicrobiota bacterium]